MTRQCRRGVRWTLGWLVALTLAHASATAAPAGATASKSFPSEHFGAYLDGLLAAQFDNYNLAGMTFVLIHQGKVVQLRGHGLADLHSGTPVDPARHLFRPGSVSKLFTWTAVMQLVEAGKLDLDADAQQYVTQFDLPNAFNTPLTLKHLLTHTPGLEDGAAGFLFGDEPADLIPLAESLALRKPTQVRPPGTQAAYSNWATALAGLIVANVSGLSFEDYVQQRIFDPLQMRQATFDEPLPDHLAADMATGYIVEQGMLEPLGFEYIKNFGPAGALSASSAAMANFMLAHLHQGRFNQTQLLQPDTVRQMHGNLFAHADNVAAMAHGFYETWRHGQRFIGHGGDTIAFHSELLLDPTRQFGLFVSFNSPDGAIARTAIVNGVIDYFYPVQAAQWDYPALPGSAERIARVAGSYRLNRRSYTQLEGVIALLQDVQVVPRDAQSIHLPFPNLGGTFVEVEPYVFEKAGKQTRLVFQPDSEGNIESMLIGPLPIMVADRIGFAASANAHLLVIALALLASLFVLINTVRNRARTLSSGARLARIWLTSAALCYLVFALVWVGVLGSINMNRVVFDFPPAGTGFALFWPILGLLFTALCVAYLIPVWRSADCNVWARLRYTYVTCVFVLFAAVLHYWNLIGWHY